MFVIGLTGGIGSGKSTVEAEFRRLDIDVIEADTLAREVVAPGEPGLQALVTQLGQDILLADGTLNRRLIRELIFHDPGLRQFVEAVIHPYVQVLIRERLELTTSVYAIVSVPLLLEHNLTAMVNRILVVDTSVELQIARTVARDHVSENDVHAIIATQISREERLARADDIIKNEGTLEALKESVQKQHLYYLSLCNQMV